MESWNPQHLVLLRITTTRRTTQLLFLCLFCFVDLFELSLKQTFTWVSLKAFEYVRDTFTCSSTDKI